jgi:protein with PEP-CTERM/exosortase system signal
MKRFATCALLAFALALNAQAKDKDKPDKPDQPVEKVPRKKNKDKPLIIVAPNRQGYKGPAYSVPDTGSTALLLGTAVLVLGIATRRFSVR